ncbi:DMT family transporter [Salinimonas chungwhensis]|uniref:DMT family transporter n=1 Tax=Salinimonas chungwhensis TaxID=265425 RepID=UPI000380C43B|nr:EamA family transporter [Salinimonas chungwhensis]
MPLKEGMALVLLGAIWGASFMFMRVAAPEFGIFALVEVRTCLATLVLLPVVLWRKEMADMRRFFWPIFAIGAINTAIPFALFNFASLHLEAGVNAILNATAPMFGAMVAFVWLHERLSKLAVTGLGLGFVGVTIISEQKIGGGELSVLPILAACLATCCYGIAACMMKRFLTGAKPLAVATGSQAVASVLLLPLALMHWPDTSPSPHAWTNAVALAVAGTGIAYILYFHLIAAVGPSKAITVAYLVPLFGIVWGLVLLNETVSGQTLVGGACIMAGVGMTTGITRLFSRRGFAPAK